MSSFLSRVLRPTPDAAPPSPATPARRPLPPTGQLRRERRTLLRLREQRIRDLGGHRARDGPPRRVPGRPRLRAGGRPDRPRRPPPRARAAARRPPRASTARHRRRGARAAPPSSGASTSARTAAARPETRSSRARAAGTRSRPTPSSARAAARSRHTTRDHRRRGRQLPQVRRARRAGTGVLPRVRPAPAGRAESRLPSGRRWQQRVRRRLPGWLLPILAALLVAAVMTGVAILISRGNDEGPEVINADRPELDLDRRPPRPPRPSRPRRRRPRRLRPRPSRPRRPQLVDWPPSQNGYTIVIASLPASGGRAQAVGKPARCWPASCRRWA